MIKEEKKFYSLNEVADALGISRQAVWARVKRGTVKAEMVGKYYVVSSETFNGLVKKGTKCKQ